jgi:hypothetical protein
MKIIEGIQKKGREVEIPDCGREDLPEFFNEMGYKVGAEIGVATGFFSEILAKGGFKLYSVDPYLSYPGYDNRRVQERLDKELEEATERLKPYNCEIVRKMSMDAVKDFEDESLDFVYIDGHHELKHVIDDICEWSKKVRKGGVVSGHDFVRTSVKQGPYVCHVKQAVRAYTDAYDIYDWYVLGSKHFPKGVEEKRDRWRSWMFFRK